jgi:hypothetical protein
MPQRSNNDKVKENKKASKKTKRLSSKNNENFNTGSHSPSSVRKVSAGYDDTGMGSDSKNVRGTDKKITGTQQNPKANLQKIRMVMNRSGRSNP